MAFSPCCWHLRRHKSNTLLFQDLNSDMFACVLSNLVSFIKTSYENAVNEVPTAALLTGINMPDHAAQFTTLAKEIKRYISPHVVCLSPQDCQNLKQLVENVVDAFVNKTCESSDEVSMRMNLMCFTGYTVCLVTIWPYFKGERPLLYIFSTQCILRLISVS